MIGHPVPSYFSPLKIDCFFLLYSTIIARGTTISEVEAVVTRIAVRSTEAVTTINRVGRHLTAAITAAVTMEDSIAVHSVDLTATVSHIHENKTHFRAFSPSAQ